jgi:hypothetical protein
LPTTSGTIALSGGAVSGTTGSFSGDLSFNSGYGSAATAYGCRAWVNFNGTANSNLSGTYSRTGTTVTVTATAHGLIVGNSVNLDFTSGTAADGIFTVVTVADANTFTITHGTSGSTSGNVTLLRNTIRASGNVSSITDNGTGNYTVNFTTALVDANYSAVCITSTTTGSAGNIGTNNQSVSVQTYATSSFTITVGDNNSDGNQDAAIVNVSVFR